MMGGKLSRVGINRRGIVQGGEKDGRGIDQDGKIWKGNCTRCKKDVRALSGLEKRWEGNCLGREIDRRGIVQGD